MAAASIRNQGNEPVAEGARVPEHARALLRKLKGVHSASIWSVSFSPDGKTLCLGSNDSTASLIDVATAEVVRKIEGVHSAAIWSVSFSPDGKTLCLGSGDRTASLIDVATAEVVHKIEGVHSHDIWSV
eukprot:SAG31_NODE_8836_length_1377_cov_3.798122_1_plen_128_part_10